jgi:hypothetical protein
LTLRYSTVKLPERRKETGAQENQYLLDSGKGITNSPQMVVCYRKTLDSEWIGFGQNLLVEFYREAIKLKYKLNHLGHKEPEYIFEGIAK